MVGVCAGLRLVQQGSPYGPVMPAVEVRADVERLRDFGSIDRERLRCAGIRVKDDNGPAVWAADNDLFTQPSCLDHHGSCLASCAAHDAFLPCWDGADAALHIEGSLNALPRVALEGVALVGYLVSPRQPLVAHGSVTGQPWGHIDHWSWSCSHDVAFP